MLVAAPRPLTERMRSNCQVEETHNGKLVLVPKLCSDVLEN